MRSHKNTQKYDSICGLPVWEIDCFQDPQPEPVHRNYANDCIAQHFAWMYWCDKSGLLQLSNAFFRWLKFYFITSKNECLSDLLQGQLSELGQGAGQQANDERGWSADDVEHCWGQHRDVSVLPYKGVKQRHNSMAALGESTARRYAGGKWVEGNQMLLNDDQHTRECFSLFHVQFMF